jgi:hypothetical protein
LEIAYACGFRSNGLLISLARAHPSPTASQVLLTTFDHDGVGQLKKVTLPDGSFIF